MIEKAYFRTFKNKKNKKRSNLMRNKNRFQEHCQSDHSEICDWAFTTIDQAKTEKFLKKNELYWYYKLKTYTSLGLDERDAYAVY